MRKTIFICCLITAVSTSSAFAEKLARKTKCELDPKASACVVKAPEIDPSSAVAACTLLAGGVAVMLGRRSKGLPIQAE